MDKEVRAVWVNFANGFFLSSIATRDWKNFNSGYLARIWTDYSVLFMFILSLFITMQSPKIKN